MEVGRVGTGSEKNLPAVQETWVQFLGWEDPLGREWLLTAAFLPGKSPGQRSLAGYGPWGGKESDMTEQLSTQRVGIIYSSRAKYSDLRCKETRIRWRNGFPWVVLPSG